MNDKNEPPHVADGYGVSVAYACLIDAVRAIQIEIHPDIQAASDNCTSEIDQTEAKAIDDDEERKNKKLLHEQMINSSWCGLLTAFSPLIESW